MVTSRHDDDRQFHFYEPVNGTGLAHSPFNAIIAPRPIGWVSTVSGEGVLNLAPFSFFNAFNYTPPIIGFSCTGEKDTLVNARAKGEFCWNLVTSELAEQMNATSAAVGPQVDEFALAGLTAAPSRVVGVPHVREARVVFECRTSQVVPLVAADGSATPATVVFGEVVGVRIDRDLLDEDGVYRTAAADPVLRGGGPADYFTLNPDSLFRMRRPDSD